MQVRTRSVKLISAVRAGSVDLDQSRSIFNQYLTLTTRDRGGRQSKNIRRRKVSKTLAAHHRAMHGHTMTLSGPASSVGFRRQYRLRNKSNTLCALARGDDSSRASCAPLAYGIRQGRFP